MWTQTDDLSLAKTINCYCRFHKESETKFSQEAYDVPTARLVMFTKDWCMWSASLFELLHRNDSLFLIKDTLGPAIFSFAEKLSYCRFLMWNRQSLYVWTECRESSICIDLVEISIHCVSEMAASVLHQYPPLIINLNYIASYNIKTVLAV